MSDKPIQLDRVKRVLSTIQRLAESKVLVGIPEDKGARKDAMNNAALGYIHEHGAPEANIPARPFLVPGIQDARGRIASAFKKGMRAAMSNDVLAAGAVESALEKAGLIAVNAVKRKISIGPFAPLSANTLRARDRKMLKRARKGKISAAEAAAKLAARKPLVDTGQMRNAITYVVKK